MPTLLKSAAACSGLLFEEVRDAGLREVTIELTTIQGPYQLDDGPFGLDSDSEAPHSYPIAMLMPGHWFDAWNLPQFLGIWKGSK